MLTETISRGSFITSTPVQQEYDSGFDGSYAETISDGYENGLLFFVAKKIDKSLQNNYKPADEIEAHVLFDLKNYLDTFATESLINNCPDFLKKHTIIKVIHHQLNQLGNIHKIHYSLNEVQYFFLKTKSCFRSLFLDSVRSKLFPSEGTLRLQNSPLWQQDSLQDSSLDDCSFTSSASDNELPTPIRRLDSERERNVYDKFKNPPYSLGDSSKQIYVPKPRDIDSDEHGTSYIPWSNLYKCFMENQANRRDKICLDNLFSRFGVSLPLPIIATDFLKELNKRNCYSTMSQVLSFLSDEDLQSVSCVSSLWRNIVLQDVKASRRKKKYLRQRREKIYGEYKENKHKVEAKKTRRDRVPFSEISNKDINICEQPLANKTSKMKYDAFLEVAKNLNKTAILLKCPKCQFPAKSLIKGKYLCTRAFCAYEFCTKCFGPYLGNHFCSAANVKKDLPTVIVGSKESKMNLRRMKVHGALEGNLL